MDLPPPPDKYREEYLVDTETNEIIYPKILPSSIVIPEGNEGEEIEIPGISGGGIDYSTFIYKRINVSGTKVPKYVTRVSLLDSKIDVPDDGLYLVIMDTAVAGLSPSPNDYSMYRRVYLDTNIHAASTYYYQSSGGYLNANLTAFAKSEDSKVKLLIRYENSMDGVVRTMGTGSYVEYRLIKLCDI